MAVCCAWEAVEHWQWQQLGPLLTADSAENHALMSGGCVEAAE